MKPKHHFNDHRGVYKDKGVTKGQLVYLEERKQRLHPKKYHRKSVKQQKHEDRKAKKEETVKSNIVTPVDTSLHNNLAQPATGVLSQLPDTTQNAPPKTGATPAPSVLGPDMTVPAEKPVPADNAAKKEKKKHKKNKQKEPTQQ